LEQRKPNLMHSFFTGFGDDPMADSVIAQQIIQELGRLSVELQQRVLDFAQTLALSRPKGVSGRSLLWFAGAIEADDLQAMSEATEAGCEQVDADK
jgi:hypothetical protein